MCKETVGDRILDAKVIEREIFDAYLVAIGSAGVILDNATRLDLGDRRGARLLVGAMVVESVKLRNALEESTAGLNRLWVALHSAHRTADPTGTRDVGPLVEYATVMAAERMP